MTPQPLDTAYQAALNQAALFDISSTGKLLLTGPEVPLFLNNLSTNDFNTLPLGAGCEVYFCNHLAKALFHAFGYHISTPSEAHAVWLETTPGRNEALFKHLDKYLISEQVEFTDITTQYAQWHLCGPQAAERLRQLLGPLPLLQEFEHLNFTLPDGVLLSVRRRCQLGLPGYDLVLPSQNATSLVKALLQAGVTMAGADCYETLRIEAGTPVYGQDIDENRFVAEVGRVERAISYTKGCYLGQEPIVMARDRAGHAPRAFVKLHLPEAEAPAVGCPILAEGAEVGSVTSSAKSLRGNYSVALGYVRWKHREPGTQLAVAAAPATVVALDH